MMMLLSCYDNNDDGVHCYCHVLLMLLSCYDNNDNLSPRFRYSLTAHIRLRVGFPSLQPGEDIGKAILI